jgi:hypothetical protein
LYVNIQLYLEDNTAVINTTIDDFNFDCIFR